MRRLPCFLIYPLDAKSKKPPGDTRLTADRMRAESAARMESYVKCIRGE